MNKKNLEFCLTTFNALIAFVWTQLVLPEYVVYSPIYTIIKHDYKICKH